MLSKVKIDDFLADVNGFINAANKYLDENETYDFTNTKVKYIRDAREAALEVKVKLVKLKKYIA